ncbi:phospholipase [Cryomorpha ignava]|uniref:Phospholipase n=1 Tax=Cryomorpha ignava TaxID=101383 RepID=A0A7K3WQ57_9FLAO|nr:phospholipase [Cryomorpha ignava]NEN23618.1 phospholipase [Cryomorpha ignava]
MDNREVKINISKTARYYTFGNANTAKHIWFVLHGYGQLAKYFIRNFEHLNPDEYFIVAPEGLYRFYLNGFDGRVGATWMTKEARLDDITDYVNFLDQVFETTVKPLLNSEKVFTCFGFSQGVATASRWIAYGKYKPEKAIFWAGSFPPDLEPVAAKKSFESIKTLCCVGIDDPFVKEKQIEETKKHLSALNIHAKWITYSGEHKIPTTELNRVIEF